MKSVSKYLFLDKYYSFQEKSKLKLGGKSVCQ